MNASERNVLSTDNKNIQQARRRGGPRGSNEPPLLVKDGGFSWCKCERSISTMRRLNNYMRCTMDEGRLSSLAIMHIKYDMPIHLDEVVNLFEGLHPRMMQLQSLLYETE